ncbi:MAG: hypothetical protein U0163_14395 [Gemmatimonadaceae bacterium]
MSPVADLPNTGAVVADTLERGCTRSFYGRDWRFFHHIKGLIAQREVTVDAEREFKAAGVVACRGRWGRITVELAAVQAAQGAPGCDHQLACGLARRGWMPWRAMCPSANSTSAWRAVVRPGRSADSARRHAALFGPRGKTPIQRFEAA